MNCDVKMHSSLTPQTNRLTWPTPTWRSCALVNWRRSCLTGERTMLARAVLRNLTSSRRLSDLCLSTTQRHTKSAVRRQSFDEPRYVEYFCLFVLHLPPGSVWVYVMIRMVSHMAEHQLSWTLFSIHMFFRCCELFDSLSLDYSHGFSTHKTGRLT